MNFKQRLRGWAAAPVREGIRQGIEPFVARASHFIDHTLAEKRERNPLLACGARYFSQNDEDGILLEILRRIELTEPSTFLEIGAGDGLENNTLILLAHGWSGGWVGGESLSFDPTGSPRLGFAQAWITRANVTAQCETALMPIGKQLADVRVASLDLDGNDFHLASELLGEGMRPDLFVVEYNAKFPPGAEFVMDYNELHSWSGDYFSASLKSWHALFQRSGHRLVVCNLTGVNAFFVDQKYAAAFSDVPTSLPELFMEGRYVTFPRSGYATSPRTVLQMISHANRASGAPVSLKDE